MSKRPHIYVCIYDAKRLSGQRKKKKPMYISRREYDRIVRCANTSLSLPAWEEDSVSDVWTDDTFASVRFA